MINRIQIQNSGNRININFNNVHKIKANKDLLENKIELEKYLKNLFNLIEGESFNLKTLKKILKFIGMNPDLANILCGFNALLNMTIELSIKSLITKYFNKK